MQRQLQRPPQHQAAQLPQRQFTDISGTDVRAEVQEPSNGKAAVGDGAAGADATDPGERWRLRPRPGNDRGEGSGLDGRPADVRLPAVGGTGRRPPPGEDDRSAAPSATGDGNDPDGSQCRGATPPARQGVDSTRNQPAAEVSKSTSEQSSIDTELKRERLDPLPQMEAESKGPFLGVERADDDEGLTGNASSVFDPKNPLVAPLRTFPSRDSLDSASLVSTKGHVHCLFDRTRRTDAVPRSPPSPPSTAPSAPGTPHSPYKRRDTFLMLESFKQEMVDLVSDLTAPSVVNKTKTTVPVACMPEGSSHRTDARTRQDLHDGGEDGAAIVEASADPWIVSPENEIAALKARVESLNKEKTDTETFLHNMQRIMDDNDDPEFFSDAPSSWPQRCMAFEQAIRKRQASLTTLPSQLELSQAESTELKRELQHVESRVADLLHSTDRAENDLGRARETLDSQTKASTSEIRRLKEQVEDLTTTNKASCLFFRQLDALLGTSGETSTHDERQCRTRLDSIRSLQSRLRDESGKLEESRRRQQRAEDAVGAGGRPGGAGAGGGAVGGVRGRPEPGGREGGAGGRPRGAGGLEEAPSAAVGGGLNWEVESAAQEADPAARGLKEGLSAASGGRSQEVEMAAQEADLAESHGTVARLEAEWKAALAAADRATAASEASGGTAETEAAGRRLAETEAAGRRLAEARLQLEVGRNALLQLELGKTRQTTAQLGDTVQRLQVEKAHLETDVSDLIAILSSYKAT